MTYSKGNKLIFVALMAVVGQSAFFPPPPARAQEEEDEGPKTPEIARLEAAVIQAGRAVEAKRQSYEAVAKERPVIRHYRMPQGVIIPTPTPVPQSFIDETRRRLEAELARSLAEQTPTPPKKLSPLRSCGGTSTEKTPRKSLIKGTKKKEEKRDPKDDTDNILYDLVVVKAKDAPSDPDIVFGTRARVIAYPESGDVQGLLEMIEPFKIECVPYRIRVTRKFRYRHKGEDALKNYDEKADGKGKLHELMKGKVL